MCLICNPLCGRCKPPILIIKCPTCGAYNLANLANCKRCGAILPEQAEGPAIKCLYSGMMCVHPCNRHKIVPQHRAVIPCRWNTPPKEGHQMQLSSD
jgi:hypothetical protein